MILGTSSITALTRERELVSQSQLVFPSCFSHPNGHWPLQAAWKDKLGLRYALSFSCERSNAGCVWEEGQEGEITKLL